MNIQDVKEKTAAALGVSADELDYITDVELERLKACGSAMATPDVRSENAAAEVNWHTYGHSPFFSGDRWYWKGGAQGNLNEVCEGVDWNGLPYWVKYLTQLGTCANIGAKYYFIGNYQGQ